METDTLLDKIKRTEFEIPFNKGYYNLNIIGVRRKGNKVTNAFDDFLVVIYRTPNRNTVKVIFPITTEPGLSYMINPSNKKGTAILKPGQYRGSWIIGKHKGKYEALCQYKPVTVYRDDNKNDVYDISPLKEDKGIFGINIHKAGDNSKYIDKWSAGCQVFKHSNDFRTFMRLCHEQIKHGFGNKFTYTLINEEDL